MINFARICVLIFVFLSLLRLIYHVEICKRVRILLGSSFERPNGRLSFSKTQLSDTKLRLRLPSVSSVATTLNAEQKMTNLTNAPFLEITDKNMSDYLSAIIMHYQQPLEKCRSDNLRRSVKLLLSSKYIDRVIVVNSNPLLPIADVGEESSENRLISIHEKEDKLSSRFRHFALIRTNGVLSLDDDIFLDIASLLGMFQAWKKEPDNIAGSVCRGCSVGGNGSLKYNSGKTQLILLTSYAVLGRRYLLDYMSNENEGMRNVTDKKTNCEDILMNHLIRRSARSHEPLKTDKCKPPRYVCQSRNALHRRPDHYIERSKCLELMKTLVNYPLCEV